jgi:ABC-2 type transport system permease protein
MAAHSPAVETRGMARRMPWLLKYKKAFEMGFATALEYRVNFLISLISAAYPIFIQYFLWTAIYLNATTDLVYGFTFQQMMAYTFMAGLVARIVRTGFEYEIMDDIKSGKFSRFLVQPLGYFPYRLASYFGNKLPNQVIILLILTLLLVGLNIFWGVTLEPLRIGLFLIALALAVVLNFLIFYGISAIAFWLVEIGFLFEGIRIVFILFSGGIFPLEVFGPTFMRVMDFLPFKFTVSYPINVLNGKIPLPQVYSGFGVQLLWIGVIWVLANLLWRIGSKRYVAVGG